MPKFDNPFTRKKREALERERQAIEQQQRQLKAMQDASRMVARQIAASGRPVAGTGPSNTHGSKQQGGTVKAPNVLQLLTTCQDQLARVKQLPGRDLEAFPLVNEAQRIVARLREAVQQMPGADQEVWQFQIKELEDELKTQTDRILADASTLPAPPVNPRYSAPRGNSYTGSAQDHSSGYQTAKPRSATHSTASRSTQPQRAGSAPGAGREGTSGLVTSSNLGPRAMRAQRKGYEPPPLEPALAPVHEPERLSAKRLSVSAASNNVEPGPGVVLATSGSLTVRLSGDKATGTQGDVMVLSNRVSGDLFSGLDLRTSAAARNSGGLAGRLGGGYGAAEPSTGQQPSRQTAGIGVRRMSASGGGVSATASSSPFQDSSRAGMPLSKALSLANNRGLAASSLARRHSSTASSCSGSGWSAAMTAAAAASYAAQAGVALEDLGGRKVIKKKTRGIKVGYGLEEEDSPAPEVSHVIPGQPMPGPDYVAQQQQQQQTHQQLQQHQQEQLQQQQQEQQWREQEQAQQAAEEARANGRAGLTPSAQAAHDPHVQALIAARQAYVQAQALAASAAPASPRAAPLGGPPAAGDAELLSHRPSSLASLGSPLAAAAPAISPQQHSSPSHQTTTMPSTTAEAPSFTMAGQDCIEELQAYLAQLTGPLQSCQQAATVAAAQVVQSLAGRVQAALAAQTQTTESARATLQRMTDTVQVLARLQERQAAAAASDDFEGAAGLDPHIREAGSQVDRLQARLTALKAHAIQLAGHRTTLVALQARACTVVAEYLRTLAANHGRLLAQLDGRAGKEAEQAHAAHASALAVIEEARMQLAGRKVQLLAAVEEVDARVHLATGSLQRERSALAAQYAALAEDVAALRSQLAEREAALAAAASALQEADARIHNSAANLLENKQRLAAHQEQLSSQERAMEARAAEAHAERSATLERLSAAAAQRGTMAEQGTALQQAADKLMDMAARITARVDADQAAATARAKLQAAADAAQHALDDNLKRIASHEAQLAESTATMSSLQSRMMGLQQVIAAAGTDLPALEAAKAAAAAQRDFKEAGRLHALLRGAMERSGDASQQLAVMQQQAAALQAAAQQASAELSAARADEPRLRREAAFHRFNLLTGSMRARRGQIEAAGTAADVIAALEAEEELEAAEAAALATAWGFSLASDPPNTISSPLVVSPTAATLASRSSPSVAAQQSTGSSQWRPSQLAGQVVTRPASPATASGRTAGTYSAQLTSPRIASGELPPAPGESLVGRHLAPGALEVRSSNSEASQQPSSPDVPRQTNGADYAHTSEQRSGQDTEEPRLSAWRSNQLFDGLQVAQASAGASPMAQRVYNQACSDRPGTPATDDDLR